MDGDPAAAVAAQCHAEWLICCFCADDFPSGLLRAAGLQCPWPRARPTGPPEPIPRRSCERRARETDRLRSLATVAAAGNGAAWAPPDARSDLPRQDVTR
jgi:hypothetical protein